MAKLREYTVRLHDRAASVPAQKRFLAFQRVRAFVPSIGRNRIWVVESYGPSADKAKDNLRSMIERFTA